MTTNAAPVAAERIFRFGPFELRPERGQLLNDGERVGLGSRALAILALLAERAGEVVSVQDIADTVWPNLFVQENNLRVQMSAIRRELRAGAGDAVEILNIPGRGYRLRAEVTVETLGEPPAEPAPQVPLRPLPLPLQMDRLIGRAESVAQVLACLQEHRLVTIVGPGGIGKTRVALAALSALPGGTGACLVDLANCSTIEHVATAASAALQSPMGSDATPAVLVERLSETDLVLLLDNCEHMIGIVAHVTETVLRACPRVRLLATSREPLRVAGEMRVHIQPLPVPVAETAEAIAENPSVMLFVERARAAMGSFAVTEDNAGQIAAICRSLDGLPLALELAAAAVPMLGLPALASGLAERLQLLALGRRTLARHETLEAMLDWSFELLPPAERAVLGALSCFRAGFDLAAATAVAALDDGEARTIQAVLNLTAKSLIVLEASPQGASYRLLETTKAYARSKLEASGNAATVARRHADWVQGLLARAQEDWLRLDRALWWERYGPAIDDVRAALVWAHGPQGDKRLGVRLTLASAALWLGVSQLAEYRRWQEQALATLDALGEAGGAEEIQLQLGMTLLLFNADRLGDAFVRAATRVLEIGEAIGDPLARATGLWLLAGERAIMGDYPAAIAFARRMLEPEPPEPAPYLRAFGGRVVAVMSTRTGRLLEAEAAGDALIADLAAHPSRDAALRYDHSIVARGNHAVTLALRGRLEGARALIAGAVRDGTRMRDPSSFCYLLSSAACPVALWLGDDDLARHYAALLAREAQENRFTYMAELAAWYAAILHLRTGAPFRAPEPDRIQPPLPHDKNVFITACAGLCDTEAVARAEASPPHWATAEILRAQGEARLHAGDRAGARALFERALTLAEAQGAGLWALRAATSLAGLMPVVEAEPIVAAALAGVDDDRRCADVRRARALLAPAAM